MSDNNVVYTPSATLVPFLTCEAFISLISGPVGDSSEEEVAKGLEENNDEAGRSDIVPQIVYDGLDSNNRISNRTMNPPKILTFKHF